MDGRLTHSNGDIPRERRESVRRRNKFVIGLRILLPFVVIAFAACSLIGPTDDLDNTDTDPPSAPDPPVSYTVTPTGPSFTFFSDSPDTSAGTKTAEYTLELGPAAYDAYLVFSNTSTAFSRSTPTISTPTQLHTAAEHSTPRAASTFSVPSDGTPILRDRAEAVEFNARVLEHVTLTRSSSTGIGLLSEPDPPPAPREVGATETFLDCEIIGPNECNVVEIPATLRGLVTDDTADRTLEVWVADNAWDGDDGDRNNLVTGDMVKLVTDAFLLEDSNDDIYGWVTAVYGEEWAGREVHGYSNLIDHDKTITILLYDILNDNSTTGGVVGYFWSKDNILFDPDDPDAERDESIVGTSNERLIFYIDSVLLATPDPDTAWTPEDFWPQQILVTLAHEFQHMINFYQRPILRGVESQTWLNEMLSLMAEDLVAQKLDVPGPRGMLHGGGDAGSSEDADFGGRLNLYAYWNDLDFTYWPPIGSPGDNDRVLISYAHAYAFGAYLARNFGGAAFLRDAVQNSLPSRGAVEYAVRANSDVEFDTLNDLLLPWAAAGLLSRFEHQESPLVYNTGGWIETEVSDAEFLLGSINLHNYAYPHDNGVHMGPWIYDRNSISQKDSLEPNSKMLYRIGSGLSGTHTVTVTLPRNVRAAVVLAVTE
ncbi:MAG: hypothetical protein EA426_18145 [Spirochaetaceae bacterium]|nr:MAG: hypothetical protein EA426_18145 [Spirochaetaceae bacterium]